jgi:lipid-A-disaccharide synthase-like uncharacterized protein
MSRLLSRLARVPVQIGIDILRVVRDPYARWVAAWFFAIVGMILGLGYMYIVNSGFGFFFRSCAAYFSEGRLAALLMLSPIAFALALSSVGEAVQWMEARRRGRRHATHFFWKFAGLGGVLLLAVFLLARC